MPKAKDCKLFGELIGVIVPLLAEYCGQPRLTPVGSGPEPTT